MSRLILLEVSMGITFALFCIIVVLSVTKPCFSAGWRCKWNQLDYDAIDGDSMQPDDDFIHERIKDATLKYERLISPTTNDNSYTSTFTPRSSY